MKLNPINYTNYQNINTERNTFKKNNAPSFGNAAVSLATFIESKGFLGEFLAVDATGMAGPRAGQGFLRNRKELGHLNYKAGTEETIRELLSGPAFFFVPLGVLSAMSFLRGKTAKVNTKTLAQFKNLMKKTPVDLKNADLTKTNFVNTVADDIFKGYEHKKELINEITELMHKNVNAKFSIKDTFTNLFKKESEKVATTSTYRAKAVELMTKLNKENAKNLDNAGSVIMEGKSHDISELFHDMRNYIDDFTKSASKTEHDTNTFINKFHQKANNLRNLSNILAVAGLSSFLVIIPKLYQTGETFPGQDGLEGAPAATPEKKEAV